MMKKVALSILLLLLPVYSLSIDKENESPEEIKTITGKLQVQNSEHEKILNVINEIFTKNDDNCPFSFSNSGFRCAFNRFDVNFNNGSKAVNALFTPANEQIIKDAAEDYKVRLMLELHNLNPPHLNLKNFKKDFQAIWLKYFSELRRKFFHLYRSDESGQDGGDKGGSEITSVDQLTERLESTYDSASTEDGSSVGKDTNQDLSELMEEDIENNPDAPKVQGSSYSFSSHTSKKIIFDGNNVIEENESSINDGGDEQNEDLLQGPMTKEKALSIFLKNTSFTIEGNCTEEEEKKENPFTVFFNSQLSRNQFSTVCNANGKNLLRGANGGGNPLSMESINPEDLNKMMADMLKFFESQTDANGMLLPFLSKMNFMDALENLGVPPGLDLENMFSNLFQGNLPAPCCRGARPNIGGPNNNEPTTNGPTTNGSAIKGPVINEPTDDSDKQQ
ncbi:hypothetical protein C922_02290 [Plasmodium inui San Antonio 1]|uniref:Parasitophorous vacuolar protein 1 n=1 Tax=Plasmodium inui San Antonio 1 TaxID=1237626 RepID=W7A5T9_9APIC|nr:hypothetical protein C922_02290 [Plasmodium inui San Antonio 1]EUD67140.1 hypothetical protein C922_02290 [Plasmodium inui San Antonio 1]